MRRLIEVIIKGNLLPLFSNHFFIIRKSVAVVHFSSNFSYCLFFAFGSLVISDDCVGGGCGLRHRISLYD